MIPERLAERVAKEDVALGAFVLLACLLRIYLASTQSYWALGGLYDDSLQNKQALALIEGRWLGDYDQNTLIKGISYPLFLAFGRFLHLKYGTSLGIAICFSCIVFLMAARKICNNRAALAAVFLLLLFCPIAWGSDAGVRIYRNAVAPWTALVVFSCLVSLFQLRSAPFRSLIPWLVLLGLSLAFEQNLREDSVWVFPAIAVTLVALVVSRIRHMKKDSRDKISKSVAGVIAVVAIPLVMAIIPTVGIVALNQHYYGVALANDRTQGGFAEMVEQISAIADDDKDVGSQWVTKSMLDKAVSASPTLQQAAPEIEASYENWTSHFGNGIIKGDYIQWVMRDAMGQAGVFQSAKSAQEFSSRASEELRAAFASGALDKDPLLHPSSQGPGLSLTECMGYIPKTASNTLDIIGFRTMANWFPSYTELAGNELYTFQQTTGLSFSNEAQDRGATTNQIESGITGVYSVVGIPLFCISFAAFIASIVLSIKRGLRCNLASCVFNGAVILGSALLFVYIVTVFIDFLGGWWPLQFYATPAYVLVLAFDATSVLGFLGILNEADAAAKSVLPHSP